MIKRDPKKKCFARKCEDCQWYQVWDVEEIKNNLPTGLRKCVTQCSIQVLVDEIPRLRGAIDGCQSASNETRNVVIDFGSKAVKTIAAVIKEPLVIDHEFKKIEGKNE